MVGWNTQEAEDWKDQEWISKLKCWFKQDKSGKLDSKNGEVDDCRFETNMKCQKEAGFMTVMCLDIAEQGKVKHDQLPSKLWALIFHFLKSEASYTTPLGRLVGLNNFPPTDNNMKNNDKMTLINTTVSINDPISLKSTVVQNVQISRQ